MPIRPCPRASLFPRPAEGRTKLTHPDRTRHRRSPAVRRAPAPGRRGRHRCWCSCTRASAASRSGRTSQPRLCETLGLPASSTSVRASATPRRSTARRATTTPEALNAAGGAGCSRHPGMPADRPQRRRFRSRCCTQPADRAGCARSRHRAAHVRASNQSRSPASAMPYTLTVHRPAGQIAPTTATRPPRPSPAGPTSGCRSLPQWDIVAELPGIRCPVLALQGRR